MFMPETCRLLCAFTTTAVQQVLKLLLEIGYHRCFFPQAAINQTVTLFNHMFSEVKYVFTFYIIVLLRN